MLYLKALKNALLASHTRRTLYLGHSTKHIRCLRDIFYTECNFKMYVSIWQTIPLCSWHTLNKYKKRLLLPHTTFCSTRFYACGDFRSQQPTCSVIHKYCCAIAIKFRPHLVLTSCSISMRKPASPGRKRLWRLAVYSKHAFSMADELVCW